MTRTLDKFQSTSSFLFRVDEAFLASTTREVQSVAAIEDRRFEATGPVTARAAAALSAHIRAQL